MVVRMTVGLVVTVRGAGDRRAPAVVAEAAGVQRSARPRTASRRCASIPAGMRTVQATEVLGQRKLLKWTVPGTAHFADVLGFHRACC